MAVDRGSWLSTTTALFFAWAFLACGVRMWVIGGRKQTWGLSDTAIVSAVIIAILHVAMNFWAVNSGYGRPLVEIEASRMETVQKVRGSLDSTLSFGLYIDYGLPIRWRCDQALFIGQISYIGSTGLSRVSTAFFIGQLTRHPPRIRVARILASVAGGWTVASILLVSLRGDLSQPWTVLDGEQSLFYRWIAVEAGGLATEVAVWLLSLYLIWGLQMKCRKQVLILVAFGCRLLYVLMLPRPVLTVLTIRGGGLPNSTPSLIPLIAMRLYYLSPGMNFDPTLTSIVPHILMEAAMDYGLAATSVTSLKPLLKPFHTGAIVNNVGSGESGAYSQTHLRGQGIYILTPVSKHSREVNYTASCNSN
ncbi:hypothetical protein FQN49_003017 [Arthroderma sp. PD_2]|nr:hypothetical protein FQN49_003017 [Arthroderma sp. PD_2]